MVRFGPEGDAEANSPPRHAAAYTRSVAAPTITEAVVLRSFAFGEADRVLHVYTQASGRIGVVAKGVRRTKSRFGGRLEPFSHVELSIHRGRGELGTVTGASLVRSHDAIRTDAYRLRPGSSGSRRCSASTPRRSGTTAPSSP